MCTLVLVFVSQTLRTLAPAACPRSSWQPVGGDALSAQGWRTCRLGGREESFLKNKNLRIGSSCSVLMTRLWHPWRCPQWLPSACPWGVAVLLPWETQGPGLCWVWMGLSSGSQALFLRESRLCFLPVGSLQGFNSIVVTN